MGKSIGILNNIRSNASQEYQNRIPEATQQNIQEIGNALQTYTVLHNEFCDALINKIGKTILESKLFNNRLARFKQGAILTQQDVEEIFVSMSKAEGAYDPTGPNPLGRREAPDVKTIYHRMNRQDVYTISIGDLDFKRVFRSEATLDSFISSLINSVYSGANYDEWLAMKNLIATYPGYTTVQVPVITDIIQDDDSVALASFGGDVIIKTGLGYTSDSGISKTEYKAQTIKELVKSIRKVVTDLTFPTTEYNAAGVRTWTDPNNLVLLVHKDVLAELDVEVLAKSFNMGKTDIQIEVIPMDDFGGITKEYLDGGEKEYIFNLGAGEYALTYAVLVDKDWFRVYDTLSHFEPQRNAHGLFTNYFYHVHQILSASTFKNAVRFCGGLGTT